MLKERIEKKNLIVNSLIDLKDDDGKGKGRYFVSRFIEPGLAHYKELGDIVITKETLDKFIQSMVGCPVIIDHKDVTDKNVDKLRVGTISRVWFNEQDGWYYCEGILTDDEAIDLVKNQGWNVSCSYSFVSDESQKTYHGKPIDMVFTDGEFLHLAIVEDPRYEGANIVVNKNDNNGKWITIKPNGEDNKGRHLLLKDGETPKEAIERTYGKDKKENKQADKQDQSSDKQSDEQGKLTKKGDIKKYLDEGWLATTYFKNGGTSRKDVGFKLYKGDINAFGLDEGDIDISGEDFEEFNKQKKIRDKGHDYDIIKLKDNSGREYYELKRNGKSLARDYDKFKIQEYIDKRMDEQIEEYWKKQSDKQNKKATNNIGDITMQVLNELKDFIKSVVSNEKEDEMEVKNEDKRKLIDEVGGILKDKVDEEVWRTVIGKLEKLSYEPSEDDKADNKCKNEDDEDKKDDEKETENKCKNEDDKKDDEKEGNEDKKEDEDVTKNEEEKEVKNSMKDLVMGGNGKVEEEKLYISRKERLEEGNKF